MRNQKKNKKKNKKKPKCKHQAGRGHVMGFWNKDSLNKTAYIYTDSPPVERYE
jgi:hypothetical protein